MLFSQKISIESEAPISAALSGATVTAGSSSDACIEDPGTAGDYLCPVPWDEDGGANDIEITLVDHADDVLRQALILDNPESFLVKPPDPPSDYFKSHEDSVGDQVSH